MSNNEDSSVLNYTEENFTAYSVKVIEHLCKKHRTAVEIGQSTDFDIEQIWSQDLKSILGGQDGDHFRDLLRKINEKTGYLEIQGGKVRLAEGKKSICAEVGIIID